MTVYKVVAREGQRLVSATAPLGWSVVYEPGVPTRAPRGELFVFTERGAAESFIDAHQAVLRTPLKLWECTTEDLHPLREQPLRVCDWARFWRGGPAPSSAPWPDTATTPVLTLVRPVLAPEPEAT
jgi:hypothetical protein